MFLSLNNSKIRKMYNQCKLHRSVSAKKTSSTKEMASCIGYLYNLSVYENCVYLTVNSELLITLSYLVKSTTEDV